MDNTKKATSKFDINTRGKLRHIQSVRISERVAQKCLCDRLDDTNTSLKRSARRQLNHKLRQQQKRELRNMAEVCVCCGAPLGDAELGTMMCSECSGEQ